MEKEATETGLVCRWCKKPIMSDERRFYSRQVGMVGNYHWECYVAATRAANMKGYNALFSATANIGEVEQYENTFGDFTGIPQVAL